MKLSKNKTIAIIVVLVVLVSASAVFLLRISSTALYSQLELNIAFIYTFTILLKSNLRSLPFSNFTNTVLGLTFITTPLCNIADVPP